MGNTASASLPSAQGGNHLASLQSDIPKFIVSAKLADGKLMKSYRCKVGGMGVVVKVYLRRDANEDLSEVGMQLGGISSALLPEKHPNVLPYQLWTIPPHRASHTRHGHPAYLVRQHIVHNLYDRLSTRPFLAPVEKLWIAYQLLKALDQCHSVGVCHGDLKSENVLLTSWDWLMLADFAPFKPTYLPDDHPAEFNYFFQLHQRNRCYLAPERFYSSPSEHTERGKGDGADVPLGGGGALDDLVSKESMLQLQGSVLSPSTTTVSSPTNSCTTASPTISTPVKGRGLGSGSMKIDLIKAASAAVYKVGTPPSGGTSTGGRKVAAARTPPQRYKSGPLAPSMDIFSLGCVIAEVFLDGEPPLTLPDLLQYRSSAATDDAERARAPALQKIDKLDNTVVRRLVLHMLSRDPADRKTAGEYLQRMEKDEALFPSYFGDFLYPLMVQLQTVARTPDDRLQLICRNYSEALRVLVGVTDERGSRLFGQVGRQGSQGEAARSAGSSEPNHLMSLDEVLKRSTALLKSMGFDGQGLSGEEARVKLRDTLKKDSSRSEGSSSAKTAPRVTPKTQQVDEQARARDAGGLVVLAQVVCSSLRHLRSPQNRVLALCILDRFGRYCDDEARLQRLVPHVVSQLDDSAPAVRATAIRCLRNIMCLVDVFPPSDADIFPLYIFPELQRLPQDPEELVRTAFAESLPSLAETSKRFLDISHALKVSVAASAATAASLGSTSTRATISMTYDKDLMNLRRQVARWVVLVASSTDSGSGRGTQLPTSPPSTSAKLALLRDVPRLCMFFGQDSTLNAILPQLITFLNDRDWALRAAFCEHIPAVCAFVGEVATAEFILPCIENALNDGEEVVVWKALRSLESLVRLRLLSKHSLLELLPSALPILSHPGLWPRESALALVSASIHHLGPLDATVFLLPLLSPYLRYSLDVSGAEMPPASLKSALRPHVSRAVFEREVRRLAHEGAGASSHSGSGSGSGAAGGGAGPAELEEWLGDPGNSDKEHDEGEVAPESGGLEAMPRHLTAAAFLFKSKTQMQPVSDILRHYGRSDGACGDAQLLAMYVPSNALAASRPHFPGAEDILEKGGDAVRKAIAHDPSMLWELTGIQTQSSAIARSEVDAGLASLQMQGESQVLAGRFAALRIPPLPPPFTLSDSPLPQLSFGPATAGLSGSPRNNAWATPSVGPPPMNIGVPGKELPLTIPVNAGAGVSDDADGELARDRRNVDWRPRQGVVVASLKAHNACVNRLAVSPDQSFFASCSSDGTTRIWELRGLERTARLNPQAQVTYTQQQGRILDACVVEGSRSLATGSSDGSVHVWRVETAAGAGADDAMAPSRARVCGAALVRKVETGEGPVLSVSHFNAASGTESVLLYASQRGRVRAWDLRASREAWVVESPPELGSLSALTVGSERAWFCTGTSSGYLTMYDMRFPLAVQVWRHSSRSRIHRLSTCCRLPGDGSSSDWDEGESRPNIFVAAGANEVAAWDLSATHPLPKQCFRVADGAARNVAVDPSLPTLEPLTMPSHPRASLLSTADLLQAAGACQETPSYASVRALVGRISHVGHSYILTAGTDRCIRYWDFQVPSRCYVVSGVGFTAAAIQSREYPTPDGSATGGVRLTVFKNSPQPSDVHQPSLIPLVQERGLNQPSAMHRDAITDLKITGAPQRTLLSCSRDGCINVWR
jgi:phosphoinositide-3-kinase regulatory subunit 4